MIGKVLFTKKNTKGFFGYIESQDGATHYFDTSCVIKGNFIKPGAEVEFDVIPSRGGKTQAINVRLVKKTKEFPQLEKEKAEMLHDFLEEVFAERLFVDCATLPVLFKQINIDYKEYADDLKSFIDKYLPNYSAKKKYISENKEYPMVLLRANSLRIEMTAEICSAVLTELEKMISETGFFQAMKLPLVLKQFGIGSFRDYSPNMDAFMDTYFPGLFVSKQRVVINGKEYPKIYVPVEKAMLFEEKEASSATPILLTLDPSVVVQIRERLSQEIENSGYIPGGRMPLLLRESGVDNYKLYAVSIEDFINKYLGEEFEMKKDELINGKKEPSVVVPKDKFLNIRVLKEMFEAGDFEGFLRSKQFRNSSPLELGVSGVELALKALAGYLNDSIERFNLNEFQRILISVPTVTELKQYKDDELIQELGVQSAFVPLSSSDFAKVFTGVHNGKKTLNNNWNGIVERFWSAKNNLAVYLTALWIIISQKDTGIDLYIDEAFKEKKINSLPLLLKVYSDFMPSNNAGISLRLTKKIVGHCFDCNDAQTLIESYRYFNIQVLPELSDVIDYLCEKQEISGDALLSWFHGGIGELIAEKITNYCWWKDYRDSLSPELVKVLSTVLWEYPLAYYSAIIYNQSCPAFDRSVKERILVDNFVLLCEEVKSYKKAFILASFVYFNYLKPLGVVEYDSVWNDLREHVKNQVLEQLSPDILSSRAISNFRFDSETSRELELYYCDKFVAEQVRTLDTEELLDGFIGKCVENKLSFITQWVVKHTGDVDLSDKEKHFRSILSSKHFAEALLFVKKESSFSNSKKIELIKETLTQNFEEHLLNDDAYHIFTEVIPVDIAEQYLLQKLAFADSSSIMSLIAIYAYKSEWIKALYLFVPFKKIHRNTHLQFIDDFSSLLSAHRIRLEQYLSHFEVMRAALKVFDSAEFDMFITWARGINIPSGSRVYTTNSQIFDSNLQAMLKEENYEDQWRQIAIMALRTDNNEKQDTLRYSIIASFIGRYGLAAFDSLITDLSRKRVNSKGYVDFYMSLWKGLLSGKYSANFIRISRPLIDSAPLTFWNLFYDVAVCKNHVFSSSDFELSSLNGLNHQTQVFYESVLKRYSYTREAVFAKIALRILNDSKEVTSPMFEQYIPYCTSKQDKHILITTIINLISQNRFLDDINMFFDADCWRCDEAETQLLRAMQAVCVNDASFFLKGELLFSEEEINHVCQDFLECVENYPNVRITRTIFERIQSCSKEYQYRLVEMLLRVQSGKIQEAYLRRITWNIPQIIGPTSEKTAVKPYVDLMTAMYKRQAIQGSNDIVFLRNRYYRILAANMLSAPDGENYSDDELIALMQSNRHFNAVYPEYKKFKTAILEFVASKFLSESQKEVFLLGLISNNWQQFVDNILLYDTETLALIRNVEAYTNYRDLNIYFLRDFICDHNPDDDAKIPFIEACSPLMASVMKSIRKIYLTNRQEYDQCKAILVGICHVDEIDHASAAYKNLKKFLQFQDQQLRAHWEMYMDALLATSYVKTIINILSDEVRNRRIDTKDVILWKPVFVALNEVTVYYYLLSVRYATERKIAEAKKTYALIPSFEVLPEEWKAENANLQAYLSGKVTYFYPAIGKAVATFSVEKEATNISFIQSIAVKNEKASSANEPSIDVAVKAYKTIIRDDIEDILRYNSYLQFFSYVKKPEDLYDIYRQVESQNQNNKRSRLTFNELVIEYGCLVILFEDQLSLDQKLDILIELFNVYSFLNDINREKKSIIDRLVLSEQTVLETPGIHLEKWISCQEQIKAILSQPIIGCNKEEIDKWFAPINICSSICSSIDTETGLLCALEQWRHEWNLFSPLSNFENAFIHSVDGKILALKNGINLSIVINNSEIDDDSIFYQIINTSPSNNVSVLLSNIENDAVCLIVEVGINNSTFEKFENAEFSSELMLRPGDSCGQCYRLPSKITHLLKDGDVVTVIVNLVYRGKVICNNRGSQNKFRVPYTKGMLSPNIVSNRVHYGTAVPAFSASIKGFGREREKADLRELLDSGLAIIYGPSRVGKSSLLNYVANEYFDNYCTACGCKSVMQVRIADEQFSKNDYVTNMLSDGEPLVFKSTAQIMDYLFCTPLLIAFSGKNTIRKMQMCKTAVDSFPEAARVEILEILQQKGRIIEKYSVVSRILSNYNCELWILFDEFQQIVERWVGSADDLAELCTFIKYNQTSNSIKLVFCGSDDLVRIFECVSEVDWAEFKVKTSETWVFVGQLSSSDFASMMNDRTIWKDLPETIPWNISATASSEENVGIPAVLQSLYEYTGGNAICGKIFGEELLEKLKQGKFARRRFFYPSDITQIAYELLSSDASKLKSLLITHTTKNLQNELPYLLYIASELSADINKSDVSLRKILAFFTSKDSEVVETALAVLIARGIIKSTANSHRYNFSTLFYYDFFKDMATESVIQKLRDTEKSETSSVTMPWLEQVVDIVKKQPIVDRADIAKIIDAREDDKLKTGIGELYGKGTTIHTGTYIGENTGTNIGTQNNVQVNIQSMSNAFATLLSGDVSSDKYLAAFRELPSVQMFIPQEDKKLLGERITALHEADDEEALREAEYRVEELTAPAEQEMTGTYIAAAMNSTDFFKVTDEQWEALIHVSKKDLEENLPNEFITSLGFAVMLHNVFETIRLNAAKDDAARKKADTELDYCPVAIMYCKVVEALLKELHTPIYARQIADRTLSSSSSVVFGDLLHEDGTVDTGSKDLTIGSFSYHIVKPSNFDETNNIDHPDDFSYEPKMWMIKKITRVSSYAQAINLEWSQHAVNLAVIQGVRNKSAHEARPITKANFDWLIQTLFDEGELLRIGKLAARQYPSN